MGTSDVSASPCFALALALVAAPDVSEAPVNDGRGHEPQVVQSSTTIELAGHGGGSVGNVLLVPFALPGLSGSLEGSQQLTFFGTFFLRADATIALGVNVTGDALSFAGYGATAALGLRIQPVDAFVWEPELRAGITSISYLPVPLVGFANEGTFLFPLGEDDDLRLDVQLKAAIDFLVIVPAPSASASLGFRWRAGPFFQTTRVGVEVDAILAGLANSLTGGFFVTLNGELRF